MSKTTNRFILDVDFSSSEDQTNDHISKKQSRENSAPITDQLQQKPSLKRRRRILSKSIQKQSLQNTESEDKANEGKNNRYQRSLQKFIQERQAMANKITFCNRSSVQRKTICSDILEMSTAFLEMNQKEQSSKKSILKKNSYRFQSLEKTKERKCGFNKKVRFNIDEQCVPERKNRFRNRLKNQAYPISLHRYENSIPRREHKSLQKKEKLKISPNKTSQKQYQEVISSKPKIPSKQFCMKHLNLNQQAVSIFTRDSSGMNFFSPEFDLYFRDDFKHFLTAKKVIGPKFHYLISLDKSNASNKNSPLFCGKIIGDFSSDVYSIYAYKQKRYSLICTSIFKQNKTEKAPKINQVYLLKQNIEYEFLEGIHSFESKESLDQLYLRYGNKKKIHYLRSKMPEYHKEINQYTLNFGGRISRASIKNFILEDPETNKQVMMFGRGFGETFNLEFGHPLSMFIAFSLTLPYFQNKS